MEDDLEEIIEKVYTSIHEFLISRLGDNLSEDNLAIDIEKDEKGEVHFNLELVIESLPYSKADIQEIVDEAISIGKEIADKYCPSLIIEKKELPRIEKNE